MEEIRFRGATREDLEIIPNNFEDDSDNFFSLVLDEQGPFLLQTHFNHEEERIGFLCGFLYGAGFAAQWLREMPEIIRERHISGVDLEENPFMHCDERFTAVLITESPEDPTQLIDYFLVENVNQFVRGFRTAYCFDFVLPPMFEIDEDFSFPNCGIIERDETLTADDFLEITVEDTHFIEQETDENLSRFVSLTSNNANS